MICPQCGENQLYREVYIAEGRNGRWQCDNCGWYEGHEIDAMIDRADFQRDVEKERLTKEDIESLDSRKEPT